MPSFLGDAVKLNGGSQFAQRGGGLTGAVDSPAGIFSCWERLDANPVSQARILNGLSALNGGLFGIRFSRTSDGAGFSFLTTFQDTAGNNNNQIRSSNIYGVSPIWRHRLVSWDFSVPVSHMYISDVSDKIVSVGPTIGTQDYTFLDWGISYGDAGTTQRWNGGLAELYFCPGQYLDFSVTANRRKFISADLLPVNLGSDGSTPTGTIPAIYMHLDSAETADDFMINRGGGGNFNISGGPLSLASTNPFPGSRDEVLAAAEAASMIIVYGGDTVETLNATDGPANTATLNAAVAETGAAVASPDGPTVHPAAMTESGAASEATTGLPVYPVARAEALAGAEVVSSAVTFAGTLSEAGASVETPAATAVEVAAQAETGAAVDSPNAGAVHPSAIAEAGAASNTVDGPTAHPGDLPEAVNSTSVQAATMAGPGALAETGAATSTQAATQVSPVAIANVLTAADVMDALKGVLIESVLLSLDRPDAQSVVLGPIAQSMPATDAPDAVMSTPQQLVNSLAPTDSLNAVLIARGRLDEILVPIDTVLGAWTAQVNISSSVAPADVVAVFSTLFAGQLEQTAQPLDVLTAQASFAAQVASALGAADAVTAITLLNLVEVRAATDSVSASVAFFAALFQQASPGDVLVAHVDFATSIAEALAATSLEDAFITFTGLGTVVVVNRARYSATVTIQPDGEEA